MASAIFLATLRLISKFCSRYPQVPSMAEHSATRVILVPVSFMRSRLRRPMFCARRWQGAW